MVDISNAGERERDPGKLNGNAGKQTLNSTISSLREHAQSFAKSLRHSEFLLDRVPVPSMELDGKARILRTNDECAMMLNGSATALPGKSLFSFVAGPDSKRLRESLMLATHSNKPCALRLSIRTKDKSYPVEMRMRRELIGSETRYMAVLESVSDLRETDGAAGVQGKEHSALMNELVLNLSRATDETAMATVGSTAAKPSAVPRHDPCRTRWQLGCFTSGAKDRRCRSLMKCSRKALSLARFAHTNLFSGARTACRIRAFPALHRLLKRCHCRNVAFLPINRATAVGVSDGSSRAEGPDCM
jgi:hypothetical protein